MNSNDKKYEDRQNDQLFMTADDCRTGRPGPGGECFSKFSRNRELKKMIDRKADDILVVSNDPQESYEESHIPGAISFPWADTLKAPVSLPRNKTLILYCSCAHEEDSSDMAAKLARFGYRNIKVLEGGFLKWSELKYPIEKKK